MLNMVALWQLLILVCFGIAIGGAFASARVANVGAGGYAVAIAIGVVVGAGSAWTMWLLHKAVSDRPRSEWYIRGFYFSKLLWIAASLLVAEWLSSALLRLVF